MPIFDQSYRPYNGPRTGRWPKLWTLTWAGLRPALKKRGFQFLMLAGLAYPVVQIVLLYAADYSEIIAGGRLANLLPQQRVGERLTEFLENQVQWLVFLMAYVGSGLISRDLRSNALPLYISRPFSRLDYVLGKWGSLLLLGSLLTVLPAILLYIIASTRLIVAGDEVSLLVGAGVTLGSALTLIGVSLLTLAISSLSKKDRAAGIYLVIGFFFFSIAGGILSSLTQVRTFRLVSPTILVRESGRFLMGMAPSSEKFIPEAGWIAVLVVLGIIALSSLVLWLRLRARNRT